MNNAHKINQNTSSVARTKLETLLNAEMFTVLENIPLPKDKDPHELHNW